MINLKEFLLSDSIFTAINGVDSFPFLADKNLIVLDKLLSLEYGDKTVFNKLVNLPMVEIAEMIVLLNSDSWENLIAINSTDFDVGASNKNIITENVSNTENRINSRDDLNQVSAFNSDELITNDGTISNSTDDLIGETIRTVTNSTIDLTTAYNNLSLVAKNNIMNVVLKDVSNFLTLSIY